MSILDSMNEPGSDPGDCVPTHIAFYSREFAETLLKAVRKFGGRPEPLLVASGHQGPFGTTRPFYTLRLETLPPNVVGFIRGYIAAKLDVILQGTETEPLDTDSAGQFFEVVRNMDSEEGRGPCVVVGRFTTAAEANKAAYGLNGRGSAEVRAATAPPVFETLEAWLGSVSGQEYATNHPYLNPVNRLRISGLSKLTPEERAALGLPRV